MKVSFSSTAVLPSSLHPAIGGTDNDDDDDDDDYIPFTETNKRERVHHHLLLLLLIAAAAAWRLINADAVAAALSQDLCACC